MPSSLMERLYPARSPLPSSRDGPSKTRADGRARRPRRAPRGPGCDRGLGVHRRHGQLAGLWHDVLLVELLLEPAPADLAAATRAGEQTRERRL